MHPGCVAVQQWDLPFGGAVNLLCRGQHPLHAPPLSRPEAGWHSPGSLVAMVQMQWLSPCKCQMQWLSQSAFTFSWCLEKKNNAEADKGIVDLCVGH